MKFTGTHFEPPPTLADAVNHFYCIQSAVDYTTTIEHLSPNFDMLLLSNFGAPARISFAAEPIGIQVVKDVAILGPMKRMLNYEILPGTDLIVTVFSLDGFYRLFNTAVEDIQPEKVTDPDTLFQQRSIHELWRTLKNTTQLKDRINILSNYISAFISEPEDATLPLKDGLPYFNNPLVQPVKAIAQDTKLSERTIQVRFKKYVGFTPKEMLRFIRFKQVLKRLQEHPGVQTDWYDIIHDFGYHDQSHLIKDFQHYIGTTPQNFVKQIQENGFCITRPGKYY